MKLKYGILMFAVMGSFILGCQSSNYSSGVKKPRNIKKFECLDSVTTKSQMKAWSIIIPPSWCSYLDIHSLLTHSPKSILEPKKDYQQINLSVFAFDHSSYRSKNIEESLHKHMFKSDAQSPYNPVYDEDIHEIYGKYYIIKQMSAAGGHNILHLKTLFNYDNRDYIISYTAPEKDYELYINDVLEMILSFKIIN